MWWQDIAFFDGMSTGQLTARLGQVCIQIDEFCIQNDEFCI